MEEAWSHRFLRQMHAEVFMRSRWGCTRLLICWLPFANVAILIYLICAPMLQLIQNVVDSDYETLWLRLSMGILRVQYMKEKFQQHSKQRLTNDLIKPHRILLLQVIINSRNEQCLIGAENRFFFFFSLLLTKTCFFCFGRNCVLVPETWQLLLNCILQISERLLRF